MKSKYLMGITVLLFTISCGPKLNSEAAGKVVKSTFNLTEKDKVEILGVLKESSDVMLVKFRLNENDISSKMRHYDKGWQLDEIQNPSGNWVPATSLVKQFDPTEKIKTAVADINHIGTILANYVVDNGKFSFLASVPIKGTEFYEALVPFYTWMLPDIDPWGSIYDIYCGKQIDGSLYGIPKGSDDDFLIVSKGRDGKIEGWIYDPKNPEAGIYSNFNPDKDLIYLNGLFIRCPKEYVKYK